MSLEKYKDKRSFRKTPEPTGGKATSSKLQFVVQKHAASHLHYDFRLEVRGVLKSWAVPKGPSLNPADKRLAMLVEDHPFDYKDFEGIIPEGNYGPGTVIVWDEGTYEPLEKAATKKEQEKIMLKEFYSGSIKIKMNGKKLKGEFALVRTEGRGDNAWLLIKHRDSYAKQTDITLKDKSVVSRKTIEQMANDKNANEWQSNRKTSASKTRRKRAASEEANAQAPVDINELIKRGKKQAMPKKVSPMLCTLTKEPIDDADFLYEIKWDGYRIISYVQKDKVRMDSRSALDYTKKYPPVVAALKELNHHVVLDGEVVIFNEEGLPDFDALQKYNGHNTPITYCVFDILWLDGYNVMHLPLVERKQILQSITEGNQIIRYSESFDNGPALYEEMLKRGLEGIVAKKKDSTYNEGERANNWLKTPTRKRQEFVIGAWAESEKNRAFRSLLFGAYNKGKFEWIGRSGGGYKEKEMPDILKKLKSLEIKESPFVNKVLDTKGAIIHWVKPELVANFEFATWTKSGRIRKPATFLGFRNDKKAKQVVREIPEAIKEVEEELQQEETEKETNTKQQEKKELTTTAKSGWRDLEKIKVTSEQEFNIGDCNVMLHNIEREVWKGIPKAKLIQYYHSVSRYILPYLKDRPLSLHVKPYGASADGLYIKDMEGRQPDCAEIFTDKRRHEKEGKRNIIDYLVCNNEATLLYMIDIGCIDINPWMSRIQQPEQPDYVNVDLDPSDEDFKKVIQVAQAAKQVLEEYKLKSFIKTSGKTGMHIYIPVIGINNAQARIYSKILGEQIHKKVPKISTLSVSTNQRGNKVFIDPSQNDYADTLACVYSARPFRVPTVSTPLEWKEVNEKLSPSHFTIDTIIERIKRKGDLFKDVDDDKYAKQNFKALRSISD